MLVTLALQIFLLPFSLGLVFTAATVHSKNVNILLPFLLLLSWLCAYSWILNWPNFPPRLVQDWLWIVPILLLPIIFIEKRAARWAQGYALAVLIAMSSVVLIPVFSFEPGLNDYLDLTLILAFASWMIVSRGEGMKQDQGLFLLAGLSFALALFLILAGSSLLGFLCLALAAAQAGSALVAFRWPIVMNSQSHLVIVFIFAIIGRFYVDLDYWVLLSFAAACFFASISKAGWLRFLLMCVSLLPALIWQLIENINAYSY